MASVLVIFIFFVFFKLIVNEKSYHVQTGLPCGKRKAFLYKESDESQRMVEIVFKNNEINDCFIYGSKTLAEISTSKKLCKPNVVYIETNVLSAKALQCSEWLLSGLKTGRLPTYSDSDFPEEFNNKIDRNFFDGILIYPGTKWCGDRNIAENYNDLGKERETDMCCRKHDQCPDRIWMGETKYNLTNNNVIHVKNHCDCDHELMDCLKSVNKSVAQKIGRLYFNLIQSQCFRKDYPIVMCREYKGIPLFWKSCQKYILDRSKQQIYQFFDATYFE